mmetsp:Transcript_39659/g.48122  ORF Transcript_39659/g.48122 Transcript_39659/m.48122 type:complete len:100 (-) Transcript_39659:280-579(-)
MSSLFIQGPYLSDGTQSVNVAQVNSAVQQDWDNREFVDTLRASIQRLADFLNDFDNNAKTKLANLNGKLTSLERKVEFVEGMMNTINLRNTHAEVSPSS